MTISDAKKAAFLRKHEGLLGAIVDILKKERTYHAKLLDERLVKLDENAILRGVAADTAAANLHALKAYAENLTLKRSVIVQRGKSPLPGSVAELVE